MSITAHCLVKNEENFVWYAIKSVIDFVDKIIVFDTGSADKTVEIIQGLVKEYPNKIIFEEKGPMDKKRHTALRQEMVDKTTTDWFMVLDGDEVWTERGMEEAVEIINKNNADCIESFFYECVGDIYHTHYKPGYKTIRFVKRGDAEWKGDYGVDTLVSPKTGKIITEQKDLVLKNKFWHLTHLRRSAKDNEEYSSGTTRINKRRLTYFLIGRIIKESAPEVFLKKHEQFSLSKIKSFIYFIIWTTKKLTKNVGQK